MMPDPTPAVRNPPSSISTRSPHVEQGPGREEARGGVSVAYEGEEERDGAALHDGSGFGLRPSAFYAEPDPFLTELQTGVCSRGPA